MIYSIKKKQFFQYFLFLEFSLLRCTDSFSEPVLDGCLKDLGHPCPMLMPSSSTATHAAVKIV